MKADWVSAYSEIATAIGTVGAVVTALVLAGLDGRRRRKEQQRAQAERISGWMMDLPHSETYVDNRIYVQLVLQNSSDQLVYNLIASVVNANTQDHVGGTLQYRTYVGRLPPGRAEYKIEHPGSGMHKKFSIELAFEDARGYRWVRKGKGLLQSIKYDPLAYYGIDPPVGWLMP